MEFVIVTCNGQSRSVFVDQQDQGVTGQRLSVPAGVHVFDLGPGDDYVPRFQEIDVQNTGPLNPLAIAFAAMAVRAVRRVAPKRTRKPVRKRAAARKAPARRSKSRAPAKTTRKRATKRTAEKRATKRSAGRKSKKK